MTMRKSRIAIAATITTLLVVGGVSIAEGDDVRQVRVSTPSTEAVQVPDAAFAPAEAQFSALRGSTAELPEEIARSVRSDEIFGLDADRAVAVPAPEDEEQADTYYIVPGTKGVCVAILTWGRVCNTYEQLERNGSIWMLTPAKNPKGVSTDDPPSQQSWDLRGIAPDGVTSIIGTGEGRGVTATTQVEKNAFLLHAPHGGDSLVLKGDDGKLIHEQTVGNQDVGR